MAIFEANSSASTSRNNAAYGLMSGMTLTPGAGSYLAIFTGDLWSNDGNLHYYVGIAVNGTVQAHTEREHYNEGSLAELSQPRRMMTHAFVTVTAGQTIECHWRCETTGLTVNAAARNLTLISVDAGDTDQVTATANATMASATPALLTGMQFSSPGASDYLAVFSCSCEGASGDTVNMAIYVGGTEVAHTERRLFMESSIPNTSYPLMIAAKVSPTAGQNVEVYWWRSTGTGTITCHERTFTLLDNRTVHEVSATANDTSTSTTDELMDSMEHTTPAAGDYLAICTWSENIDDPASNPEVTSSFYEGATQVTNSEKTNELNDSLDNMFLPMANTKKVVPSGSENVGHYWRCSATDTRDVDERTFVLLLDALAASREQEGFRFRDDDDDEASAAWLAAQDVNVTRAKETNTRLRTLVDTTVADPPSESLDLEYRKVGDPSTEWRKVPLP